MKKHVIFLFATLLLISCFPLTGGALDGRVELAVQKAIAIANDDSHGYNNEDLYIRQGNPDYDCSSLVCSVFHDAGFTTITRFGSTRSMDTDFTNAGFKKITGYNFSSYSGLQRGDVLWKSGHTEIYIGNGQQVGAHYHFGHREAGDQGGEITVQDYYNDVNNPWTVIYRYDAHTQHKFNKDPYVCSECGYYKDATETKLSTGNTNYRITSDSLKVHTGPYGACPEVKTSLKQNSIVTVTRSVKNGYGRQWYKLSDGNFIYEDYVTPFVTISAGISKSEITQGSSNSVTGKIYNAKKSKIVAKLDGTQYASFSAGSTETIDIASSKISSGVNFASLKAGSHSIVITATVDGVSTSATISFTVKEKAPPFVTIPEGDYRVKSKSNGEYLIIDAGTYKKNQNISVWPLDEYAHEQVWHFMNESNGYRLKPIDAEFSLNADGETAANGDNIMLWTDTGHGTQRWRFEAVSGGYVIHSSYNTSNVLTVENGRNVRLKAYNKGDSTQIWTIENYTPPAEKYYLDVNLTVDGAAYNSGFEGVSFDVYVGGSKVADDVSDYYAQHPKGKTYTVSDIRVQGCYTNYGSSSFFGTINATTIVTIPIVTYHKSETIPAVVVTCTDLGYTEGTKCATCGMIISQPQPINPVGHQWDEGVVTKEPTATENGERTYTCTVCGKKQTDPTPPLPYLPGDINGDGAVNNKDLTRLMKYLAGEDVTVIQAALDVNGDRAVNNKDLTRLMKYLAGELL